MCCWSSVVVVFVFGMKSRKEALSLGLCWIWYIKRQFWRFRMDVGKFQYLAFFVYTAYMVVTLFKGYFPESARFWSFWNVVIVSLFLSPHIIVYHIVNVIQTVKWYAVFSIWKFALIPSLLSMPIAWLSLIFVCVTCLFQSRCSSIKTPRYLTEWVGTSLLPSNLNLKLWSIFSFLGLKITSSVFFWLRLSLFALKQFERFDKSLFTFFDV